MESKVCIIVTIVTLIGLSFWIGYDFGQEEEKSEWLEWDNEKSFDECCLNGNKLICPTGFMKVAIIFVNGSEAKLDMSSFKMCNTHTSFANVGEGVA